MADNVAVTAGFGKTIAADEVTRNAISEKQQIIKIGFGTDGNHDGLAAESTPLPVKQGKGTEAVYPTLAAKDYTTVIVTYSSLIDPAGDAKALDIYNNTDASIRISYDGGATDHDFLPAYAGKVVEWANLGLKESGVAHVKYESGAPTVGKIYAKVVK